MLEHGGNLRLARQRYGGDDWIDLSTGINPHGYPAPLVADHAWHRLPEADPALVDAACALYGAPFMLAVAGTQAAIQTLPRLRAPARVTVAAPSYAEHAHHWAAHGHAVSLVPYTELDAAVAHSDVVVLCNPNNPTGATIAAPQLLAWAAVLAARGGSLVIDEAFADTAPHNSIAACAAQPGIIVLRSIGKFFGLAGIRVGFVAAEPLLLNRLADALGPWTISGPAQQIAITALCDQAWQQQTRASLTAAGERLHALLAQAGIAATGTPLFQWWAHGEPEAFQRHMAERHLWVRLFQHAARGIRLGLPADEDGWQRLHTALYDWTNR
ncbi:threonine-phosphate decarboxylase CobD [Massilia sp. PWRC2]|uniref:threonine-phosphate decarboxylase CobD n=1 Tax=Massilia sp. PWRC2 TaxID=2804626 RepID=UPI003CEFC9D8